jgi:hypothetical protein
MGSSPDEEVNDEKARICLSDWNIVAGRRQHFGPCRV